MFGMGLGVPMMAGLKTAPSFMSRMGSAMPGAVNAMAQRFGDPSMSGAVQAAAGGLNPKKKPPQGGMQKPQPGAMRAAQQPGGINTAPQQSLPFMQGGAPPWMQRNTGITGGMGGMMGRFGQM